MPLADVISIIIGLAIGVVFLLFVWRVLLKRSRRPVDLPKSLEQVSQAHLDPDERPSAIVSEQIEEMVREKLAGDQDLTEVKVDFATAADGSLEIWIGEKRYSSADEVPDERIRSAISEAVESFNR